jgi:hypothetical protein
VLRRRRLIPVLTLGIWLLALVLSSPAPALASSSVTLEPGWNLVAAGPGTTFPSALFGWNGSSYESTTSPAAWQGYWCRVAQQQAVQMETVSGPHMSTLATGWNLVGNPMSYPVTLTLPSGRAAFIYDAGAHTYVSTTTLAPGQGAWVKGAAGETVTFSTPVTLLTVTEDTILTEDMLSFPDTQCAIVIGASDITLDLGGHVLSGYAPTGGIGGMGVFAQGVEGITIRNGTIEGFNRGIFVSDAHSVTIQDLTIINQDVTESVHLISGVCIAGSQQIVVKDMLFEFPAANHKMAIEVYGSDVAVSNIEVHGGDGVVFSYTGTTADPVNTPSNGTVLNSKFYGIYGVGIWVACTSSVRIAGNEFAGVPGQGIGIQGDAPFLGAVTGLTIEDNYIHDLAIGVEFRGITESTIANNVVSGNSLWGIALRQSLGALVPTPGWDAFYSTGNSVTDNQASGNGIDLYHYVDCVGNIWEGNTYETKEGAEIP